MSVPTNLIPTKITGLPLYQGSDTTGVVPYIVAGRTWQAQIGPLISGSVVPASRRVDAGTGLTGGGDLSADVTLSVAFSAATPNALGVASAGVADDVSRGDHTHPAVDLADLTQTQGALPLGRGGTGALLSPLAGAVAFSDASGLALTAIGTPGQVLTSNGASPPTWASGGGTGTVTSVGGAGVVNGLTLTGTVTSAGSLTLGGVLAINNADWSGADLEITNGGTGASSAPAARSNLGASVVGDAVFIAVDGAAARTAIGAGTGNGTVTSISGTGTVSGLTLTGTVTTSGSLTLGGTLSINNANWSGTDLAVVNGGTGASDAATARTNLGAAASGAVTSSGLTMATARLLGRSTAATGAIEEITVGTNLTLSAGVLSATGGGPDAAGALTTNISGTTLVDIASQALTLAAGDVVFLRLSGIAVNDTAAAQTLRFDAQIGTLNCTVVGSAAIAVGAVVAVYFEASVSVLDATAAIISARGSTDPASAAGASATSVVRSAWNLSESDLTGAQTTKLRGCGSTSATGLTFFGGYSIQKLNA